MTTSLNRTTLLAEKGQLSERLDALPAAASLSRRSLEARAAILDEAIAALPPASRNLAQARLTFDGLPVIGTHGVVADFGAEALARFSAAVTATAASQFAPLAAMGPIPNRGRHQLLLTGTAIGSFGFQLEEGGSDELPLDGPSPMEQALESTQRLLHDSAVADDDHLADTASEVDQRALSKLREFVGYLVENDAVCGLEVGSSNFRFTDVGQVRLSLDRLSTDNLHERETRIVGEFEGVLPNRRTFEFRSADGLVVGKLGAAIVDPHSIVDLVNQPLRLHLLVTQVGSGRPRYTLIDPPERISDPTSQSDSLLGDST